ncbi:putative gpi anchored cell wall protein [Phaeomoniella chlamydospora]|uniref:Putative gpi anchored cell wall protein n=1 Tax=Phaeomoniella chlamydospora TaxID=158046 RepID=A0A0G2H977_PHACM|nr:putative gpi anchored cell wall protein [Phaeomoniella chlamydospora]
MKSIATVAALAGAAQAFVARDNTCCFHLTGSGSVGGTVGQLSDGQNRVGGSQSAATYCIDSNGGITDGTGRGCILTPPTTQFQCDQGASPTAGFAIGCDGTLTYNGSSKFYACQTGDNGENIYTTTTDDQTGCTALTLTADSCKSGCPTSTTPSATPSATSKSCPTNLSGNYQYPHLIVPVSSANPDKEYGTSYNGTITPNDISSIFNFDIPSSYSGETCSLIFLFPEQSQLETSSYSYSGDGKVDFSSLSGTATTSTDYANQPSVASDLGTFTVSPGHSYLISTFSCPAGQAVSYKLSSSSTNLNYFQDYNPSPIGLYITSC